MANLPLSILTEDKKYLDEKELYILYHVLRKKCISTMSCNAFTPGSSSEKIHIPRVQNENVAKLLAQEIIRKQEKIAALALSSYVLGYLLQLGKDVDDNGYTLSANADYCLMEGGFLCDALGDEMYAYLEDSDNGRTLVGKYVSLGKVERDYLQEIINGNEDTIMSAKFNKMAHPPTKAYREAIIEKKADEDFIALVNKLIKEDAGGNWDANDANYSRNV